MTDDDWEAGFAKSLAVFLNGDALPDPDPRGRRVTDDSFLLLFNAHHGDVTFVAPGQGLGQAVADGVRHRQRASPPAGRGRPGAKVAVAARSVQVLRRVTG